MRFPDLNFNPHRRAATSPGKTHARVTLANGATISVVFTPSEPAGPNDEPYEIQASSLEGENGDGIFYCATPEAVQSVMDRAAG